MNLSTKSTSLLQICSDGGDGTSPNIHDFGFGPAGSETEFAGFCVEDG